MKIYITTNAPFPSGLAETSRINNYCKGLLNEGVECEVITISFKGDDKQSVVPLYRAGVNYLGKSFLFKVYAYFKNNIDVIRYLRKKIETGDVILAYGVLDPFVCFLYQLFLKKTTVIREMNEIPHYSQKIRRRILRWIELHFNFKDFDGFIVISEPLRLIAQKYKKEKAIIIKIPILVDSHEYENIYPIETLNQPYIFHSGSHSENKDGFTGMIESIGILKEKYNCIIQLYATGNMNYDNHPEIQKVVTKYGIENQIHFVGLLSENDLKRYQVGATLFIINKHESFQNQYCFATKIGEYLLSRRPIIMTNVGEATRYFVDNENAYIVNPEQPELIADKIFDILLNQEKSQNIANNGLKTAERYFDTYQNGKKLAHFFAGLSK